MLTRTLATASACGDDDDGSGEGSTADGPATGGAGLRRVPAERGWPVGIEIPLVGAVVTRKRE